MKIAWIPMFPFCKFYVVFIVFLRDDSINF